MHIPKAKLLFYPPCEVKCRLQNGVLTKYHSNSPNPANLENITYLNTVSPTVISLTSFPISQLKKKKNRVRSPSTHSSDPIPSNSVSNNNARSRSILQRELRRKEMDKLGNSESPPTRLAQQPPSWFGDEALDGLEGDCHLAQGAERLRSPQRFTCQMRRRLIARWRRFAPLRHCWNPPEAQESAFLDFLFIIYNNNLPTAGKDALEVVVGINVCFLIIFFIRLKPTGSWSPAFCDREADFEDFDLPQPPFVELLV